MRIDMNMKEYFERVEYLKNTIPSLSHRDRIPYLRELSMLLQTIPYDGLTSYGMGRNRFSKPDFNDKILYEQAKERIAQFSSIADKILGGKPQPVWVPNSIDGVVAGKPMTIDEANHGKVNPNYYERRYKRNDYGVYEEDYPYQRNCPITSLAFEVRMRGLDVIACPSSDIDDLSEIEEKKDITSLMGRMWSLPYIDPDTGHRAIPLSNAKIRLPSEMVSWFNEVIEPGQRYIFRFRDKVASHVMCAYKEGDELTFYDPQRVGIWRGLRQCKEFANSHCQIGIKDSFVSRPHLLRCDNLMLDNRILQLVLMNASKGVR